MLEVSYKDLISDLKIFYKDFKEGLGYVDYSNGLKWYKTKEELVKAYLEETNTSKKEIKEILNNENDFYNLYEEIIDNKEIIIMSENYKDNEIVYIY